MKLAHLTDIKGWLEYRIKRDPEQLKAMLARHLMKGPNGCITWTSGLQPNHYALITVYDPARLGTDGKAKVMRTKVYAHRLFWVLAYHRNIPDGMQPEHSCWVRNCVNPAHIYELVDQGENTRRANHWRYKNA